MTNIQDIIKLGDKLSEVRKQIQKFDEDYALTVDPLKEEKTKIEEELKLVLSTNNIKSIKDSAGTSYILAERKGVQVTDDKLALNWCVENNAISIDKNAVKNILKDVKELPTGFEFSTQNYISVRNAKTND